MKAFIITLKGHELSERVSSECVEQAKQHNVNVEIFDAIWGKDYLHHMEVTGLKLGRVKKNKMTLGHFGNFFSHYYLWVKCLESGKPIIVLEHDGFFVRDLPDNILEKFQDVLKLDCENPYQNDYAEKINSRLNDPVTYVNSIEGIHKRKKCGWYTWGSYGYIIKPSGAKKLIDWVKANGFVSTDNQIADGVVNITMCDPSIIRLHPLYEGKGIMKFSTTTEMGRPTDEQ